MGWTRLSHRTAGAAMVALAGLVFALGVRIDEYDLWGIGLAALAALGLAIVSAVSGRVIANSDPVRVTIYISVGAMIPLLGVVAWAGGFSWPESDTGWSGLIFNNIFYAAAMIGYFVAIGRVGAPMTATLSNLEPLVAITAAFLLFGQTLAPLQLAGAAVVVGALIVAARPSRA
jgi:drug/metabolite transporter (DMT)-like permease